MNNMREITEADFEKEVLNAQEPVLADFYASWCGPCKALAPILAQLAEEFQGRVSFAKVNIDEAYELAARFNITGVPTLMLFSQGAPIARMAGLLPAKMLRSWIESSLPTRALAR